MSYANIEAQVLKILQACTSVFADLAQVTRGDDSVLDLGYSQVAILYAGGFQENDNYGAGNTLQTWTVKAMLFQRWTTNAETHTNLVSFRDSIIQHLHKYPALNGLVPQGTLGFITTEGDPLPIGETQGSGGPFWLAQTLLVPVSEIETVTIVG